MTIREFRILINDLNEQAKRIYEDLQQNLDITEELAEKQEKFAAYKNAIEELNGSLMKLLDENKPVTREEHEKILVKMGNTRKALSGIKKSFENLYNIYSPILDSVDSVYSRVDMNSEMTLRDAIEETTTPVVKVNSDPDSMGGSSNSRLMVKVKRPDGSEVEGFFTRDHSLFEYDDEGVVEAYLQQAVDENKDDLQLKNFVEAVKKSPYGVNGLLLSALTQRQEETIKESINERRKLDRANGLDIDYEYLKGFSVGALRRFGIIDNANNISYELIKNNKNIKNLLKKVRGSFTENEIIDIGTERVQYHESSEVGISAGKGSSKAGRNYALSKVASLLGASDVIAKSRPMTVEFKGNHYRGYFMEKSDGTCYDQDTYKMQQSELSRIDYNGVGKEALEQLAKIQVIDYICQNVDRHELNFALKVNEEGRVTKVTGIDNDLSFGTKKLPANNSVQHGVPLACILVIPEEMAKIISKLDKETLMGALADTGLTKAEIEAAGARLDELKKHLENNASKETPLQIGKTKIVPKDGWENEDLNKLGGASFTLKGLKRPGNPTLFEKVKFVRDKMVNLDTFIMFNKDQHNQYRYMNLNRMKDAHKVYSDATGINLFSPEGLDKHKETLSNYLKKFMDTESVFQRVHGEYTAMKGAIEKLANENYPQNMSLEDRVAFENKLMGAEKKVKEYIAYKTATKDAGTTGTTRLKEAKALAAYLKSYRESFAEAFNDKLETEMDSYYQEYLQERKLDMVANAIVRSLFNKHFDKLNWEELQSVQSTEEMIRKSPAFENMFKLKKDEFGEQTALDYFSQLAETEPMKVFEAYKEELKRASAAAKNKDGEKKEKSKDVGKKNENVNNDQPKKNDKAANLPQA